MDAKQILNDEHRAIAKVLHTMSREVGNVPTGSFRAGLLKSAADFLFRHLDRFHMQREEDHLYPAIATLEFGGADGPLALLVHRREIARGFCRSIGETVDKIVKGEGGSPADLSASARAFIEVILERVMIEDIVLIPAIDQLPEDLRRKIDEKIGAAMTDAHAAMIAAADEIAGQAA